MHYEIGKLMDAEELRSYLGISRNATYVLLNSKSFPTIRIGGRLYALRDEVDVWMKTQAKLGGYSYE